jgi:SMI1 / KNR4 family (SUKH-1)
MTNIGRLGGQREDLARGGAPARADVSMSVLNRFDEKRRALRSWFIETTPRPYGIAHGFVAAEPMPDLEVRQVEAEAGVSLPPDYRAFLLRFGDGDVGPGWFRRVREGLTPESRRPFPLCNPFLGCCSPAHARLSEDAKRADYKGLLAAWEAIPKGDGILRICDYGCAIYGALVLNGPFAGKVWVLSGDAAYYGPFGGSEPLHDEYAPDEWEPTAAPRDYSFFEWYESWLDGQLKIAELTDH